MNEKTSILSDPMLSDSRIPSDPTFSDSRTPSDPIIGIRRYPGVGKRRKSKDIPGFRLSASRRIRLSDFVGSNRIRWGGFDLGSFMHYHIYDKIFDLSSSWTGEIILTLDIFLTMTSVCTYE